MTESLKKFIDGSPDYVLTNDCPYICSYGMYGYPFADKELKMNEKMIHFGVYSFDGYKMENIDFSNAKQLYVIDGYCFYGSSLRNIILPPNIIIKQKRDKVYLFKNYTIINI